MKFGFGVPLATAALLAVSPLARAQPPAANAQPAQAPSSQKPSVVCGMTLIPANPKTDPAIKHTPPAHLTFPMKTLPPAICGQQPAKR